MRPGHAACGVAGSTGTRARAVATAEHIVSHRMPPGPVLRAAGKQRAPSPRAPSPRNYGGSSASGQLKPTGSSSIQQRMREVLADRSEKLTDLIRSWDTDENGEIDRAEFRRGLKSIGVTGAGKDIDAIFAEWDRDHGGMLDYKELSRALRGDHMLEDAAALKAPVSKQARTRRLSKEGGQAERRASTAAERAMLEADICRLGTALRDAAGKGDIVEVRRICDEQTDVLPELLRSTNESGLTALMKAAMYGRTDCVERLVSAGSDVSAVDGRGRVALMLAALNGETSVVLSLLAAGAALSAVDGRYGRLAFHFALLHGHAETMRAIADAHANGAIRADGLRAALEDSSTPYAFVDARDGEGRSSERMAHEMLGSEGDEEGCEEGEPNETNGRARAVLAVLAQIGQERSLRDQKRVHKREQLDKRQDLFREAAVKAGTQAKQDRGAGAVAARDVAVPRHGTRAASHAESDVHTCAELQASARNDARQPEEGGTPALNVPPAGAGSRTDLRPSVTLGWMALRRSWADSRGDTGRRAGSTDEWVHDTDERAGDAVDNDAVVRRVNWSSNASSSMGAARGHTAPDGSFGKDSTPSNAPTAAIPDGSCNKGSTGSTATTADGSFRRRLKGLRSSWASQLARMTLGVSHRNGRNGPASPKGPILGSFRRRLAPPASPTSEPLPAGRPGVAQAQALLRGEKVRESRQPTELPITEAGGASATTPTSWDAEAGTHMETKRKSGEASFVRRMHGAAHARLSSVFRKSTEAETNPALAPNNGGAREVGPSATGGRPSVLEMAGWCAPVDSSSSVLHAEHGVVGSQCLQSTDPATCVSTESCAASEKAQVGDGSGGGAKCCSGVVDAGGTGCSEQLGIVESICSRPGAIAIVSRDPDLTA